MLRETISQQFRKLRSVNATATSFTAPEATRTEPRGDSAAATGASVIELRDYKDAGPGGLCQNLAKFIFYGTGDADDVFDVRLIGWSVIDYGLPTALWMPTILTQLTCTMGARTGAALSAVVATELFVDTITIGSEPTTTADSTRAGLTVLYSPANDLCAFAIVNLFGCAKLEAQFDMTTNNPTGANGLVALL